MNQRAILFTGTPGVGKTTIATRLSDELSAHYINLTKFALKQNFILGQDSTRKTPIVDEEKIRSELKKIIETSKDELFVIDGHFSSVVVPQKLVSFVFDLRRSPIELKQFLIKRKYDDNKLYENLASEILDVCLTDALQFQSCEKICDLENCLKEILKIIYGKKTCSFGSIDWLGMLEKDNLLEDYLKI